MGGIIISLDIDDRGTVKIKQFTDETKKAFDKGPEAAKGSLASLQEGWGDNGEGGSCHGRHLWRDKSNFLF